MEEINIGSSPTKENYFDSVKTEAEWEAEELLFKDKLRFLTKEMAQQWLIKFEDKDADTVQVALELDELLKLQAESAKSKVEIVVGAAESTREQLDYFVSLIDEAYKNPNHFLGSGRTAEVYSVPNASKICIKFRL